MAPHAELAACVEPSGKADNENKKKDTFVLPAETSFQSMKDMEAARMAAHADPPGGKAKNPSWSRDDRAVIGHHTTSAPAPQYGIEEQPRGPSTGVTYSGRHRKRNADIVPYGQRGYAQEIGQAHHERPARTRRPGSTLWPRPVHWPTCQSCNRLSRYRWLACGDCYWLLCILCHRKWHADQLQCPCGTTYLRDAT